VYVANDMAANFLFHNNGEMNFEETAIPQGVAFSNNGVAGASMGVSVADYDRNGHFDICVTNFSSQVNDLFANLGSAGFVSANSTTGLDTVSRSPLGFGLVFRDFNLDGWDDLFVANGHIWDQTSLGEEFEYAMTPDVLLNQDGRFLDVSAVAGDYFTSRWVGRSAAAGDLDNDGDSDLIVSHQTAPPAFLRNDSRRNGRSIRIKLVGTVSARQPNGARIELVVNGITFTSHVPAGGSFQASHSPLVVIPVSAKGPVASLKVHWPGGKIVTWSDLPIGNQSECTYVLIEGKSQGTRMKFRQN
jgi:hypothetical protein